MEFNVFGGFEWRFSIVFSSFFQIYSINVEESCLEQFKNKSKKINEAIVENEFPTTSTILITIRKQIESRVEKIDWILSIFADTMRFDSQYNF